ncbi:YrdB family protein [Paenibacillus sp. GCM10023248]|uniref:YrdB family protein n=1 Tax=unclassified Paenibacillus TaxID=185978 RepID=UPI0023788891|nr:YrdB family protein [Paenibacillus sp. MAHUQ-63]MDD9266920.1 YrdB family protein [Paenibacillus sp. MAHUQ-63]
MITILQAANLGLRFLLELCLLASLSYWGFHTDRGLLLKIVLGIGTPLLTAFIWGMFLSPKASVAIALPFRLALEAALFTVAVLALYATGKHSLAVLLGAVYVLNLLLMWVWEQ